MMLHPLFGAEPATLARMLVRHGGVRPSLLPIAALMLLAGVLRLPGFWHEAWKVRRAGARTKTPADTDTPAPVFIVGHWRSGTTLLHNLMASDPRFVTPTFFECLSPAEMLGGATRPLIRRLLVATLPQTRPMDLVPVSADMPMEEDMALAAMGIPNLFASVYFSRHLPAIFEEGVLSPPGSASELRHMAALAVLAEKMAIAHPGRRLLFKSPGNSTRVDALRTAFPGAKFVHICREPGAVYGSTLKLYRSLLPQLSLQDTRLSSLEEHVAGTYPRVMTRLLDDLERLPPGESASLRYEELTRDPVAVLEGLYDALGLDIGPAARAGFAAEMTRNPVMPAKTEPEGAEPPATHRDDWSRIARRLGYPSLQGSPDQTPA